MAEVSRALLATPLLMPPLAAAALPGRMPAKRLAREPTELLSTRLLWLLSKSGGCCWWCCWWL